MLKRVSIQNFKSLKDVTLDLQKVNLLIGPNNSGKTNFLKALEYFEFGVLQDNIAAERQSYDFRFMRSASTLSIELTFQRNDEELTFLRKLTFSNQLDVESSQVNTRKGVVYDRSETGYPNASFLRSRLNSLRVYKPDPNKLNKPAPVGLGDDSVAADASNLIAFFDRIRDEYPESFAQIKADLAKCVPEFTEINFQNVPSTDELVKQFGDKTFKRIGLTNGKQKTIYWADELSEGTLYFIALLCIINQPNPPKLLLLEEPEKGIHPRRIEEVINFIFGLADEKDVQVIMTTHSPAVVDMFKDMPESVFIFDKDDEGATHVKNLQKDIIEPETEESTRLGIDPPQYLNGLGQAWKVGFLGGVPR
ncbi:AAA family ATPase [Spirosoma oryzicola]|uniref:AAA family ATPase n=1 Tax=Spirosoma oryzicola TaxID=2898794 RepID=UPI001E4F5597|nr:AAA family ATPase [Spirosoma oryzicola]UHG91823.1 AAA family ATPase [Spirosoma oryzicola]